jgi:hypothetical protein
MTTPKLDDLINDPFLQTLSGRDDSTPLTLNQVAGLLQIAPETLRKRQRQGQVPPVWEDLREAFPGLANAPVWRARLGSLRQILAAVYGTPTQPPMSSTAARSALPDHRLLDAASAGADGGWMDPSMRGRRRPKHATFAGFLLTATIPPNDNVSDPDIWPFMLMGPHRRPVDFFQALDLAVADEDTCEWLALVDYLERLRVAAIDEPDAAMKDERASELAKREPTGGSARIRS